MRVVDLAGEGLRLSGNNDLYMSLSEGCRTNFSGGSKLDIEHKSQVVIEDMGGRVTPGRPLDQGNQNDQDLVIYNTVLTSSGDIDLGQQRTGLPGLGDMKDVIGRSRNVDVTSYTSGISGLDQR
jgi:hypothetical protein